ncbi:InlB B-repeat-containing protein [Ruthenibacterium lactatiformans]|uniref:InlB B-repeat-containing protein n=2 Tax=Ruthenibacterium lactatiformans TaxID=1550024 RepID=UPI0019680431|nr:InlB B-repeat-containing protein [Ruthenibacterium lactatiformans]MBN3014855.1 InlB B-repeat-containing protein [Ruthenibacterium lactatiformans]
MKNTSNALRRVMSVVLVFAMMFTSMPTGALAEDVVDPAPSTTAAEPAASETTEPTTPEPASSEAAPAANSAVLPANDGDPAPVTFTVTFVANGETLVTQTIQQGGSAVAPDAPLVSGQRFVRWDTDFTNVQSDLTVTAVYEAITAKNMTVEYRYSDGTQAAPSHVEQAVVGEPFHKTVPSPALDGFTPDKAEVVFAVESVTEDLTVVVTYSGAARNYTVKHLFQNVEGTAYAEDEALRETLEGTTGLDTAAQAKTVEGFTALPITQVKVASSGETVVEVKYDRNSYLLTWNTDGGSYIEPQMLKYGAAVSAPADPTKVGYTFAGWGFVPETMPAAATTVTAQWANATQASYQVVYWGENLTGGYDYLYADKATGAVGGNIPYSTSLTASRMPQGLEAAGFEPDSVKSAGNVEITADGSAVKNVYFSRKTFRLSFYEKYGKNWQENSSLRIEAKYGADISTQWAAVSGTRWATTKDGGTYYTMFSNMPAENISMYDKGDYSGSYQIIYYTEKLNGGWLAYYTASKQSYDNLSKEDQMPIEGFTFSEWGPTDWWGTAEPGRFQALDGSGEKRGNYLKYARNSYNVVFENCTGVSAKTLKFEAPLSGAKPAAGAGVGRPAGVDSDYVFMGWYLDPGYQTEVDWNATMPSHNLQVYAKWAKPDYTVSFNTHGADTETPAPIGVAKYDTIEDQMPADPAREGYVFAGWYTDEAYTVPFVATQQIVRNLTLHAKWTRTDSCTYVIVAKDTEGNELKRVDGSEVEVGASVTVNAPVIDGYQARQNSQNVKILDDGQEVVFVYDKLQNWTATVHHYIEGTTEKVAEDVIRSDLTVNSLLVYSATVSGYELAEGTSYVQTATRENSEITFYYKKIADSVYTVNHYYGSNASLTETVTGTAKAGSLVTADVINKAGYTCVTSGAALSAYVAKDGSTVINVYYAANDQTYSVYYYLKGTETPVPGTTAKENVSAKFDETVTETAPAVTGYTAAGDSTMSITVGADNAANKIVFYYTVNSYPLNITYKYADDVPDAALRGKKAAEPVSRDIAFGAPYSVASPLIPGYTASVAAVAGTMAENGVTVEVVYRAATDTAYTVKHMLQDVTGDGYTEDAAARQTLHGTTGAATNAAANTYTGFTAQAVEQKTIAADGSTVVEIKYDRNSYEVTYAYVGKAPAGASALPEKATVKYGAPVAVAEAATAPGYTFSGWSQKEDFTMPAENVTITGSFTANGNTAYRVEHYQQNLAGNGFTLAETEELTGKTDTTATANPKTYTGFAFDESVEDTVASGNIAGDGSLVLKLYYTRNSYEVSYAYTGTVPAGASALPAAASYKYGADVTVAPQATAPGYTFNGWLEDGKVTASFKMPAGPVQLTGSFTANTDTRYTVEHWTEDLDGEGYTLRETEANLTGVTDTTATAEAKSYEGFRFDEGNENNVLTGVITGDGKLVLKVYYARNSYEVSYDYGAAPTGASQLPGTVSYKYGAEVRVADKATAPGYTFDGWKKDNAEVTSFTMPAGAVQLTGRFTANTDTGYKVEHYQQNLAGDAFVLFETEEQNATTDTHVSATPKDYTGFTYDGTVDGTVTEGNVAGDGSLVLKLYYTRDSYKVTYQYTGKVPTGASELPAETTEKYGAAVTVAADATAPGYTFSGWSREDGFTMPAENVTITGSFTANGETPYKVEHYQQNLEDDGYTLADTENLTGETDTTATANPKTYTGFAFDGTAEGTVASGNIAGDGSLVLKLYYTRNSYDVTYAYTGTVPTGASALPEKATVKYGAPVTVAEAATAPGYTFSGWSRNDFTMPAENVTITGSFTANSNTEYTVRHHFQNILDDAYDADTAMLSETLSGTTDTLTAAAAKTVAGFTAQSFQQKNIAGDGSTVVDIYYNRNSYTVTYAVTGTVDPNPNYKQADYRFGQNVAAEAAAAKAGYDFIGWANEPAVMPANDVTATGYFVARTDTAYQVQHYKQNLEDDGFTLAETEELTGKTDTIATANPKTYTGFTLDGTVEGTVASGNIAGDGSLVLKLYYTRNSYDVTYAYTGTVPTGASALPEKATVKYGAPVTVAEAATAPGYTFSGWSRNDFTMPAENVTITGSFTANSNTEYTVRHHFQNILDDAYDADTAMLSETLSGTTDTLTAAAAKTVAGFTAQSFQQKNIAGDGSTVVDIYYNRNSYGVSYRYLNTPAGASALPAGASYRFGAAVTVAEAATAPGYTFSGWSTGDFTMPAQDVEITGSFTANGDTAYTVEHYQQNLAGDGYDLVEADTEHLTGETDTTATANPKAYTGFTFDGTVEGTVASGNIAGDGSLVLKLYYTRNSYDVTYAYTGTVPADASALPEKAAVKYGASVTVAEAATAKGHTFSGWSTGDFTMPAQDVEITGSFTANPYNVTVEYYFDKAQDTDMTRVQSVTYGETFTTAAAAETDRNGVHYTLDWVENNGLTVSDIEADNVVRVYYAKDEEGGPDDIPDYAQIVFTYQSADVRKGTVDKSVEIHTFERLNGELLEEKKASPAGANAAGREGYAFDYWTDGTKRDVTSGMETLKSEVYTDNAEFTAYFDVDTKGTDPENPDKPDNVPDKYQAKVTYQAVNGAVTLGGSTGTELVTYVTLFDADGKWAENGTGKLAEAQVPTAAAAADYDPATERWTPAVPAEGAEITADGAVFTVTWELAISGYQVHYYYDGVEDTASAVNATGKIGDAIPYDTGKTTFDGANYVLENVDGAGKLISKDAAANIVNVNFTKDEKSDPTKDPDPEVPGDNIPDKYQATVTFEAINGVLQPKGGTDAQNTKQMTTVVTLLNENGEPAENGTGYLTEAQIPTALANLGYIANTLFWGPATPTTSYAITGDITFVADFNAEGVIPEEPPVPPVTPVGPTAPEEGPEETIDEPETPLAPAEPEAPAEEPAEEEIEEADTPLASGAAWALLNLILMLCTALVSILLLIGFLGKKKKEDENENVEYTVKRKGVTRVLGLIPAIGSIIAFLLTENMRNPMVFVDRWTWLMVLIALVQVIVCIFARKEKEEPDDNAQTPAQA